MHTEHLILARGTSGFLGRRVLPLDNEPASKRVWVQQQRDKLGRIGKEIDRLDEDEGAALKPDLPVEYERDDLTEDIEYLATFPLVATARDLGLTERGWRKVIKIRPSSKTTTVERIREVATMYRLKSK
jgi:hypothetical protein